MDQDYMTFDFKKALADKKEAEAAELVNQYRGLDNALKSPVPTEVKEILHKMLQRTYNRVDTHEDYILQDAIKMQKLLLLGNNMTIRDLLLVAPDTRLPTPHYNEWANLKLYKGEHLDSITEIIQYILDFHMSARDVIKSIDNRKVYSI